MRAELVLDLDPAEGSLLRLRLRHRYAWGTGSHAGEPVSCLLVDEQNPDDLNAALDRAMGDLGHPLFARRREARGVLSLLGSAAWPRLQAALSGDQAEVVASARELLLDAEGDSGAHLEFVLRARAADLGVRSDPPQGLFSEESGERAHALLLFWSEPGGTEWVRVMALGDPDESVRELAQLLSEAPAPAAHERGLALCLDAKVRAQGAGRKGLARVRFRARTRRPGSRPALRISAHGCAFELGQAALGL